MLIKLFGILDLCAALVFILLKYSIGVSFAYFFIFYLLIKGLLFFGDFNSILDILTGIFMYFATQELFFFFSWIFILHLLQKSFFSLAG